MIMCTTLLTLTLSTSVSFLLIEDNEVRRRWQLLRLNCRNTPTKGARFYVVGGS